MKIKKLKIVMPIVLVCIFMLVANGVQALTQGDIQSEETIVDCIVGKNIEAGTYKVTPIDKTKSMTISEAFPPDMFEDMGPGMGVGSFYEQVQNVGYITLTDSIYGVTITNGKLEKIDLNKMPVNIQTKVSNGMYIVGKDIVPGTYKVTTNDFVAEVTNLVELIPSLDTIINQKELQNGYIEITKDVVAVNVYNGALEKVDMTNYPVNIKTKVADGMYYVGKDIAPGTYKVKQTKGIESTNEMYGYYIGRMEIYKNDSEYPDYVDNIAKGYIEITENVEYVNLINITLEKIEEIPENIQTTISEDGAYVVGKDILPGTYKWEPANDISSAGIEKYSDLTYSTQTQYRYDNFGYIEITPADGVIKINNAKLTKVDLDSIETNIQTKVTDGVYIVGKDIAPGTYKYTEVADLLNPYMSAYICKYNKLYIQTGDYDDRTGSAYASKGYIEITENDYYITVECAVLEKVDLDSIETNIQTKVTDGIYLVGKDIAPGIYKVDAKYNSSMIMKLISLDGSEESKERVYLDKGISFMEIAEDMLAIYIDEYTTLEKFDINSIPVNIKTTISEDGAYFVGKDIAPGTYKIVSKDDKDASVSMCSSFDGFMEKHSFYAKHGYIEIKENDLYISISNATVTKVDLDNLPVDIKDTVSDGMYYVGKDIAPGIYKMQSIESDYTMSVETYSSLNAIYEYEGPIKYAYYKTGYIEITEEDKFVQVWNGTLTKVDMDNLPVDIKDTVSDGLYVVGKDIVPGTYKMENDDYYNDYYYNGYISTYPTMDTSWENTIKEFGARYGYIEITEEDKFVRVESATLTKVDMDNLPIDYKNPLKTGLYVVGKDIEVGTYKIKSIDNEFGCGLSTLSSINIFDTGRWFETTEGNLIKIYDTDYALYIDNVTIEKVGDVSTPTISLDEATVSAIEDKTYTGEAITPKPVVKIGSTTLVEGTDYTLAYSNNTNVGTATITITGKGNYTGTKVVTFKIVEPEVEDPNDAGYIDFNIDKTVSYDKGTVTVKIIAAKPITDYELVLTLDNITEGITVVNKLAGSNAKVKGNTVTMYMIQLAAQADKTVYPAGTVLAEITYKIPEGYFEANKGFDGTATVVNTCAIRITDNAVNYEYSLTKTVTVKDINVQEILQETLKEITIENNNVQSIKASLEQATGMTVRITNIDGVILGQDSKVGTGTVVEILDASGTVVSSETVSINGEINGDGEIDFFDAIQMISLVYDTDETFEWNEAVRKAAKFGEEGLPEFFDIITLISYIYG